MLSFIQRRIFLEASARLNSKPSQVAMTASTGRVARNYYLQHSSSVTYMQAFARVFSAKLKDDKMELKCIILRWFLFSARWQVRQSQLYCQNLMLPVAIETVSLLSEVVTHPLTTQQKAIRIIKHDLPLVNPC